MNILYMQLEFLKVAIFFSWMYLSSRIFTGVSFELNTSKLKETKAFTKLLIYNRVNVFYFLRYSIRYLLKPSDSVRLKIFAATVEAALL